MAKLLQCHYSCSSFAVAITTCCTAKVVPMPLPQHCDTGFIKGITRKMYVGVIVTAIVVLGLSLGIAVAVTSK